MLINEHRASYIHPIGMGLLYVLVAHPFENVKEIFYLFLLMMKIYVITMFTREFV